MQVQATTLEGVLQTLNKIKSFQELPIGWHYGQGVHPSKEIIARAKLLVINSFLSSSMKTNAFPGIDGEIQVTMYYGTCYLEFTLAPDSTITSVYEEGGLERDYAENLSFDQALAKLKEYSNRIWASSGLFTTSILTTTQESSRALPSKTPVTEAASPLSKKSVQLTPVPLSAGTSTGTILTSLGSLRFSGTFPKESLALVS